MMVSILVVFFLLSGASDVAFSSCIARPQNKAEGEFKVTAVEKVVFNCLNEASTGVIGKMSTSFCKIDVVEVKGKKKYKGIFMGEKGCSFKTGEIANIRLVENYSCCSHDLKLTCKPGGNYNFGETKDSASAVQCMSNTNWIWTDWNLSKSKRQ